MEIMEGCTFISQSYESCWRRGNLEISLFEDENGNIIRHIMNHDGEEWIE